MMNFLACKATVDTEVTIGFRVSGVGFRAICTSYEKIQLKIINARFGVCIWGLGSKNPAWP